MERDYNEWTKPARIEQITLISFITGSLYLLFSLLDYFIAPQEIYPFVFFLHFLLLPFVAFSITFVAISKKSFSLILRLLVLAPIIATAGHTLVIMQLHNYSSYHAEIYLIIFWVFTVSGLPMRHAIFTTLVMISISALGAFYTNGVQLNDAIMHLFWMISSFTFGLAGAYLLESSNRTVFSQHTELHQELSNKSILLKELAHRVKNNLQIVSSILYSHSKKVTDTQTKEIFDNSIQTIKAMGMIHEKLFQSSNLEAIDFKEYIKNLINLVSQNIRHKKVRFSFDSKSIMISIDNAIPLGLVVNEILTNSLKYAIVKDNEDILIRVAIILDDEQKIHLHISDNGGGIDFTKRKEGFGTQLINSLIRYQLKGEVDCFNSNGLHYDITFTDTDK